MNMTMRILAVVITSTLVCTTGLPAQVAPVVPSSQSSAGVNRTRAVFATTQPSSQSISISGLGPFARGGSKTLVHVVPAGDITVDDLRTIQEDMTIMVGIFQKMLSQAHLTMDAGSAPFVGGLFGRLTPSTQNIYLQGFGALFMMSVDFPLAPGPEKQEIPEDPSGADVDHVWQETRQSLFEPQHREPDWGRDENIVEYSQTKVEDLKTTVIKALKHAANVRALAPNELVVVTITGRPISDNIMSVSPVPGTDKVVVVEEGGKTRIFEGGVPEGVAQPAPTVLTIRAKASDINSYGRGDLNLDQFRQRVQAIMYPTAVTQPR